MQLRNESSYNCFCPVAVRHGDSTKEGMLINISGNGGRILLATSSVTGEAQQFAFMEDQKIMLDITQFGATRSVMIDAVIKRIVTDDGAVTLGVHMSQRGEHRELFSEFMHAC
ncbi:PilZ domain-containing protein [Halodesulfovibrio spirochaetisodalis]|uniref:PilZ domain-containing protein n=1 Tax=Halodesulfovibrio spirochaetisodalis TaxID=1560234 RepID=A0A1B7XDZ0_9BACT|nr:PilZ domain-containing protein [Halodesulfovibrio spirochaetisodalis]OBQ52379.1 hypothetical protein SP90_07300 [Halodesulfovibrio spirochaetisodalis]